MADREGRGGIIDSVADPSIGVPNVEPGATSGVPIKPPVLLLQTAAAIGVCIRTPPAPRRGRGGCSPTGVETVVGGPPPLFGAVVQLIILPTGVLPAANGVLPARTSGVPICAR